MIAAEVVGGSKPIQFGMTDNDRGAKSLIAQRLGYPVLLIEAIQGGNRALKEENDRRSFAMVFQGQSCRRDDEAFERYSQAAKAQHQELGLKS